MADHKVAEKALEVVVFSNCPLDETLGSGYIIMGYARELVGKGYTVKIFQPSDYSSRKVHLYSKRLQHFFDYNKYVISSMLRQRESFDVVELWGSEAWPSILFLKIVLRIRYIVLRSNGIESYCRLRLKEYSRVSLYRNITNLLFNWLDKIGYQYVDRVVVVSESEYRYALKQCQVSKDKLLSIANPLHSDYFNTPKFSKESDRLTVGIFGSWISRKGVSMIPEILEELNNLRIRFLIVGTGTSETTIDDNRYSDSVQIVPYASREQMIYYYDQLDILLNLSHHESFGLVLAEAMSRGCLLLSTSVGYAATLTPGVDYLKIESMKGLSIAYQIREVASDIAAYAHIRGSSKQRVQGLRWEYAVESLMRCYYQDLLNE